MRLFFVTESTLDCTLITYITELSTMQSSTMLPSLVISYIKIVPFCLKLERLEREDTDNTVSYLVVESSGCGDVVFDLGASFA